MKFVAFERAKQGTGASRRLRNSGAHPVSFTVAKATPC
jgi:large subunit ribosomal protein L25